jgi:hypothetical protein
MYAKHGNAAKTQSLLKEMIEQGMAWHGIASHPMPTPRENAVLLSTSQPSQVKSI